jgi:hypothetical protein
LYHSRKEKHKKKQNVEKERKSNKKIDREKRKGFHSTRPWRLHKRNGYHALEWNYFNS